MPVMRRPVGSAAEGGAGAIFVEVLIMAPASGPHCAGRIPRGDIAGMNPPGTGLLLEEETGPRAIRELVAIRTPTRQLRRPRPDRPDRGGRRPHRDGSLRPRGRTPRDRHLTAEIAG